MKNVKRRKVTTINFNIQFQLDEVVQATEKAKSNPSIGPA